MPSWPLILLGSVSGVFQEDFWTDSWNVLSTCEVCLLGWQLLILLSRCSSFCSLQLLLAILFVVVYFDKIKLATVAEGHPKALFSISTTLRCKEGATHFPGFLHFPLDTYPLMVNVQLGYMKYHFLSLWYDSTWDWTLVSKTIGEQLHMCFFFSFCGLAFGKFPSWVWMSFKLYIYIYICVCVCVYKQNQLCLDTQFFEWKQGRN